MKYIKVEEVNINSKTKDIYLSLDAIQVITPYGDKSILFTNCPHLEHSTLIVPYTPEEFIKTYKLDGKK